MADSPVLSAIVIADLEGFSRLVRADEAHTLAFVDRCLARARRAAGRFGGEIVKTTGDGWLAVFPSATAALAATRITQRLIRLREAPAPALFRVGLHLGEVRREGGDVRGHAVNVAARLEPLSAPGGVALSEAVIAQVGRAPRCRFEPIGRPHLKNVGEDIAVWRASEMTARAAPAAALRLGVIGGLALRDQGGRVRLPPNPLAGALLAALALAGSEGIAAARLVALFWPDRQPESGRAALGRLRRGLESALADAGGLVVGDAAALRLSAAVETDIGRIEQGLAAGLVDPGLAAVGEAGTAIAPELDGATPLLSAWAAVRRALWVERLVGGLEAALDRHPAESAPARAAAEALLRLEPGHEPAVLALMAHFAAKGRIEAAMRVCHGLTAHLSSRYGAQPGPEIAAAAALLAAGGRGAAAVPAMPASHHLPRIAVRDFEARPGEAALAEAFRAELLANLARFRHWIALDGGADADYALAGRCDPGSPGAHVTIRLVEPRSLRVVWSESFDVSAADWTARQRLIVGRVAASLEVYLSADRLSRKIVPLTAGGSDYDDWLRGEDLLLRWTPEATAEAEALFLRLIARAPRFAPAHASLASIVNVRHIVQPGLPRIDAADPGAAFAARAVDLDPTDARNHLALAWTAALVGQYDRAAVTLDLAVSLNPASPVTAISAAMGYAFLGDHARAGQVLDAALALAPLVRPYQWCYASSVRFLAGDDRAALDCAERSGDRILDNPGWRAAALARLGRMEEARAAFAALVAAVQAAWAGPGTPDAAAVLDWFATAYPIRRAADRAALAGAVARAAGLPLSGSAGR